MISLTRDFEDSRVKKMMRFLLTTNKKGKLE